MKFCIDFEMNQFSDRIISMGVVAEDGRKFYTLMKPSKPGEKITKFITELTGITQEMIDEAPSADDAFDNFFGWLQDYYPNEVPEYYCYGNGDKHAIEKTTKYMTKLFSIVTAQSIAGAMVDYMPTVTKFFNNNKAPIGLSRIYNFIKEEDNSQKHDALEDAVMLQYVMNNLVSKCNPDALNELPPSQHRKNTSTVPEAYRVWASGKGRLWTVNTYANSENYAYKVMDNHNGRVKYFDSITTASYWFTKYLVTNASYKDLTEIKKSEDKIINAVKTGKKLFGMSWTRYEE